MEHWDVRLFTGSYSVEDNQPVVELFGKTRDNKSIVIRYKGFKPYFHVIAAKDELMEMLGEDPDVLEMEDIKLFYQGKSRAATRITVRIPATVPKYRTRIQQEDFVVLAADIPFQHRFIYDLDLGSCVRVFGKAVENEGYTSNIVVEAKKFDDCEPFKPELKIFSFDIENSQGYYRELGGDH
jgi:DNA polymerase I